MKFSPRFSIRHLLKIDYWLLILALFAAHALFYSWALGADAVDDAYISFRYAQNAIRGYGLVFNPGERVEGFTNFLWTTLMIPLEGAGIDVGHASMLLGGLFALALLWLIIRFAKMVDAPRGAGILAALLAVMDGSFVLWSISGLETVMFAFLLFAGATLYVREQKDRRPKTQDRNSPSNLRLPSDFPFSGIFFALAAMTRPEGLFVFAITVAHQAIWRLLTQRRLFIAQDLWRGIAFTAIFAPYWLGRWYYYKSFLPNSFHAKVSASGPSAQIQRGWNYLAQFVGVHMGWIILLPPLATLVNAFRATKLPKIVPPQIFWRTYFALIVVPYSAYIVYVGGDWSVGRFFVPFLPIFYLLLSTGVVDMWTTLVEARLRPSGQAVHYAGILASGLLAVGIFLWSSWGGEYGIYIRGFDAGRATEAREAMGKWLKSNAPRGTLIAVDAAGQVPYFSELPAIDMFGINDWHIGRLAVPTLGQGTPGHEKFDLVYVIQRQPKFVVIYGNLLDSVREYERAPVTWTSDPALMKFLTLYQRRD
jgi:hypothetical protein